jgi:branched-chain amino acid transport system ATP-binding protein
LILQLEDVNAFYGASHVLHGISLGIGEGEAVSLLGRNGAGKTSTLLSVMGFLKPRPGKVTYKGRDITGLSPNRISRAGIGFVCQERGIFKSLTVKENLTVAARRGFGPAMKLDDIYRLFPRLEERQSLRGTQLSGGEQQMLSIARALLLHPELLILDEPSEGLAPMIVQEIVGVLNDVRKTGLSILLVEQNIHTAFAIADRHYILTKGAISFEGTTEQIRGDEQLLKQQLGI